MFNDPSKPYHLQCCIVTTKGYVQMNVIESMILSQILLQSCSALLEHKTIIFLASVIKFNGFYMIYSFDITRAMLIKVQFQTLPAEHNYMMAI